MAAVLTARPALVSRVPSGEGVGSSADPFGTLTVAVPASPAGMSAPFLSAQKELPSNPPIPFANPLQKSVFDWLSAGGPINRGTVFELMEMLTVHTLEAQQLEAVRAHLAEVALSTRDALKRDPYNVELNETHDLCLRLNAATFESRALSLPSVAGVMGLSAAQPSVSLQPPYLTVEDGGLKDVVPEGRMGPGDNPLLLVIGGADVPDKSAA